MDTSKEYIKMCSCPEIQGEWLLSDGDVIAQKRISEKTFVVNFYPANHIIVGFEHIWLPRQDQLQEMVGGYKFGFVDWREWITNIYPSFRSYKNPFTELSFSSFEQLWLAFVMKEKYNKVWSGSEWVKA
jgi:hypothetical protein